MAIFSFLCGVALRTFVPLCGDVFVTLVNPRKIFRFAQDERARLPLRSRRAITLTLL